MSIRFILAPAGGGKTRFCLEQIAKLEQEDPLGAPVYFILPEQATFIHERLLCETCAGGGFCRARVLSFDRLLYHAYKYRAQQPAPRLSEAGKLLLAGRVINECRSQLRVYAAAASGAGFASYLVKAAEELAAYQVAPEALEQALRRCAAGEGNSAQLQRLEEIALLYRRYSEEQRGDYSDYATDMAYLAEAIREGFIKDTDIYLDGYMEFTPSELTVVTALLAGGNRLNITLPLDPALIERPLKRGHIFATAFATWQQLTALAEQQRIRVEAPVLLDGKAGRFAHHAELAALEAALAGRGQRVIKHQPTQVFLHQATDLRSELEGIGREIIRLVREEKLRFRDISLITRDTADYERELAEVFGAMEIPYFIDAKKPLLYHPLFELVRSALECWAYHPHYEHIMRFIKNPLLPLTAEEADLLDNYALAHGLRFWQWQSDSPWSLAPLENEAADAAATADALRQRACSSLLEMLRFLPRQTTAAQLNRYLRQMLEQLGVGETLLRLADEARAEGRAEEALFHEQAGDKMSAFLDEASLLLGEEQFSAAQLLRLYDVALSGMTLSTIPPGLDQVFISSLERSITPPLKAAFVPTVNDGLLPRKIVADGLFTDADRRTLSAYGAQLAPDTLSRQFREDYLCYSALTRSGGRLYLSYIDLDTQGRELKPSPLLRRVREVLPQLQAEPYLPLAASQLIGGETDLARMAVELGHAASGEPIADFWTQVYTYYRQTPRYAHLLEQLEKGLYYRPLSRPLRAASLRRLYGSSLRSSVSRLEKYRQCPFAYFAGYGLKLKKRPRYELDPASRGQLYHQTLAAVGEAVRALGISWKELQPAQAEQLVDKALAEYLPLILSGILSSSARYQYLAGRIRNAVLSSVLLLSEHARRGEFVPVAWELPFGSAEGESLPAFKIALPNGRMLELSGRIDRVDMAVNAEHDKCYFRIIDYKSGKLSLKTEDIMAGLRLQLLVYLEVVLMNANVFSALPAEAAGIYYSQVGDGLELCEQGGEADPVGLRLSGLTVRDEQAILLADREISGNSALIPIGMGKNGIYSRPAGISHEELAVLEQELVAVLQQTAMDIMEGLISVDPLQERQFNACSYCEYAAVCGFDGRMARGRKRGQPLRREQQGGDNDER